MVLLISNKDNSFNNMKKKITDYLIIKIPALSKDSALCFI